jgi:chromosome segregation ATPase
LPLASSISSSKLSLSLSEPNNAIALLISVSDKDNDNLLEDIEEARGKLNTLKTECGKKIEVFMNLLDSGEDIDDCIDKLSNREDIDEEIKRVLNVRKELNLEIGSSKAVLPSAEITLETFVRLIDSVKKLLEKYQDAIHNVVKAIKSALSETVKESEFEKKKLLNSPTKFLNYVEEKIQQLSLISGEETGENLTKLKETLEKIAETSETKESLLDEIQKEISDMGDESILKQTLNVVHDILNKEKTKYEDLIEKLEEKIALQELRIGELESVEKELKDAKTRLESANTNLYTELETARRDLEIAKREFEDFKNSSNVDDLEQERNRLEEELSAARNLIQEAENKIYGGEVSEEDKKTLLEGIEYIIGERSNFQNKLQEANDKISTLEREKKELEDKVISLEDQLSVIKEHAENMETMVNHMIQLLNETRTSDSEGAKNVKRLILRIFDKIKDKPNPTESLKEELRQFVTNISTAVNKLDEDNTILKDQIGELKTRNQVLRNRNDALEEENTELQRELRRLRARFNPEELNERAKMKGET